jgi:Fur family iron response transcriptional regulator
METRDVNHNLRDTCGPLSLDEQEALLRRHGLRATRQRMALAGILLRNGRQHFTADLLRAEANQEGIRISLATVYNTLHHFTRAGLIRQLPIPASQTYFDSNNSEHHHFLIDGIAQHQAAISDIPLSELSLTVPIAPEGYEIKMIDVVVHLRANATKHVTQ